MTDDESEEPEVKVVDRRWWAQQNDAASAEAHPPEPNGSRASPPTSRSSSDSSPKKIGSFRRRLRSIATRHASSTTCARDSARTWRATSSAAGARCSSSCSTCRQPGSRPGRRACRRKQRLPRQRRGHGSPPLPGKLEGFGVRRLEALGERSTRPARSGHDGAHDRARHRTGSSRASFTPGYQIQDDVLRPATVAVGQYRGG